MTVNVREMRLEEVDLVISYFHEATAEHLDMLGVDPTRLPSRGHWRQQYAFDYAEPIERRRSLLLLWELESTPIGFSSVDKIIYGEEAYMHLHIFTAMQRQRGYGAACVRKSAEIYFERLQLARLYSEPNAFNVGPNRTLQKAGFVYVKTHRTVPGPLNYHQAVTRWVCSRQ